MKKNLLALWPFWTLFLIFFWPLLTLEKSFVSSDYSVQHVPWARYLYEELRENRLPYWTRFMAGGFPLLAEGQVGAFYLLNIFFYKALPFWPAYTYGIIFHFLVGALSMYGYAKVLGRSRQAAALAATCFSFGSGFAGLFYNTGSLKVLCWLPLILAILEKSRDFKGRHRWLAVCALSLLFSQQWFAGFSQMAAYAFGYCLLHEAAAFFEKDERPFSIKWKPLFWLALALAWGTAIALPQLAPTFELIHQSVRKSESAAFALWGSVPPVSPISLLFPEWGNALRFSFYFGILPLFFMFSLAFFSRQKGVARHLFLALFFFSLALGTFNPFYRWVVEFLGLSFLRNPAKFLFFTLTSFSVLAAFGMDRVAAAFETGEYSKKFMKFIQAIAVSTAVLPGLGFIVVKGSALIWSKYSGWYVARLVEQKGEAAKSAQHYMDLMNAFFKDLPRLFSYVNWLNLKSILVALLSAAFIWMFLSKKLSRGRFLTLGMACVIFDLFIYASFLGTGFMGNAGRIAPWTNNPSIRSVQSAVGKEEGLFAEFVRDPQNEILPPNAGMFHGISHAGGYSPLLLKRYDRLTAELGIADSSLGRQPFTEEIWRRERGLVDALGIRWIHADAPLDWKDLRLLEREGNFFLYKNDRALPLIAGLFDWRVIPDKAKRLNYLKSAHFDPTREIILNSSADKIVDKRTESFPMVSGTIEELRDTYFRARISMPRDGMGLARIMRYPGWRLYVNQERVKGFFANHAFIGFWLPAGDHSIEFQYAPQWYQWANLAGFGAFSLLLIVGFWRLFLK